MPESAIVTCYEVTHDGEGEPANPVRLPAKLDWLPEDYARAAARRYDDEEIAESDGLADSDLDGSSRVIEVHDPAGRVSRWRVHTRVKRCYEAERDRA